MKKVWVLVVVLLVPWVTSTVHAQFINNPGELPTLAPMGEEEVPLALGDTGTDLLYTPVTPCRVFDTRSGSTIGNGATRNFYVAGSCGIPDGAAAVMMNFVVAYNTASGDIRAWPYGGAMPGSSIINFAPVSGLNIANGVIVPICHPIGSCVYDLSVFAEGSAVHLVGDVLGYFRQFPLPAARAFAYVYPSTPPSFEATWTKGFTNVRRQATGVYCLTASGISSDNTFASVGVEWGNSSGSDLLAFLQHGHYDCNANEFEVRTYKFASGVVASNSVAFWILVP